MTIRAGQRFTVRDGGPHEGREGLALATQTRGGASTVLLVLVDPPFDRIEVPVRDVRQTWTSAAELSADLHAELDALDAPLKALRFAVDAALIRAAAAQSVPLPAELVEVLERAAAIVPHVRALAPSTLLRALDPVLELVELLRRLATR